MKIPEDPDNVILACLEKNPGDRPQAVDGLGSRPRKINFEQPWDQVHAQAWWKLHRAG
jgi:hypothetical protein